MNKCMTILLLSAITMSTVQEVYSKINDPSKNESIEPKSRNLRSNAYQIKMYWERGENSNQYQVLHPKIN